MSLPLAAVSLDVVGDVRCAVGESPLWVAADSAWWWVDIEGRELLRWSGGAQPAQRWAVEGRPGCIALHAEGGLLGAQDDRLLHLRPHEGGLASRELARVTHAHGDMRFNDGRCDRGGRFWVSSMLRDMAQAAPVGLLRCFTAGRSEGVDRTPAGGLIVGNGLAFSPEGRTLYLSDSHPSVKQVWRFELHDDGSLSAPELFIDFANHPGRPDGAAVDADGCYWICANDGGCLLRFTPQGRLDARLDVPVAKPSMCAFGGPGLDELLITSIRPAQASEPLAGATFICRPGVRGLPEVPFGGAPR